MREGEAPSYFNAEEAAALVGLVEGLLAQTSMGGRKGVQPNDLGVIATYRKQVGCETIGNVTDCSDLIRQSGSICVPFGYKHRALISH